MIDVVVRHVGLSQTDIARVVAQAAAGADRFALGLGADTAACVDRPNIAGADAKAVAAPPVLRAKAIERKVGGVHCRIARLVVEQTHEFMRVGQAPIAVAACGLAGGVGHCVFPGHLTGIQLLPHQPGDIVGDGAVAVVGERLWIGLGSGGVITVLAKGVGAADGLRGVRQFDL